MSFDDLSQHVTVEEQGGGEDGDGYEASAERADSEDDEVALAVLDLQAEGTKAANEIADLHTEVEVLKHDLTLTATRTDQLHEMFHVLSGKLNDLVKKSADEPSTVTAPKSRAVLSDSDSESDEVEEVVPPATPTGTPKKQKMGRIQAAKLKRSIEPELAASSTSPDAHVEDVDSELAPPANEPIGKPKNMPTRRVAAKKRRAH